MQQAVDKKRRTSLRPCRKPVTGRLTRAAIFLVVTVNPDPAAAAAVRALVSDIGAIVRPIGFREPDGALSCVVGFGSDAWDRLFGPPRPAELHPFREIRVPATRTPSRRRATCCSISAPSGSICASSWQLRS